MRLITTTGEMILFSFNEIDVVLDTARYVHACNPDFNIKFNLTRIRINVKKLKQEQGLYILKPKLQTM